MPRLGANAVNRAIEQLATLDLGPSPNSSLEAYLVSKRLEALGIERKIANAERVVREVFVLFPDHADGRLVPFRRDRRYEGELHLAWGRTDGSARMTVWTAGTRKGRPPIRLFVDEYIKNGLVDNAAQLLAEQLREGGEDCRPPREALLVFLLRDHQFAEAGIDIDALEAAAKERFSLSGPDLDVMTKRAPALGIPFEGDPRWSPDELPERYRPPAAQGAPPQAAPVGVPQPERRIVVEPRVRTMVARAIASSKAVLLVGPPGTGKSTLLAEVASEMCADPERFGLGDEPLPPPMWVTAEEGWTSRELVGGETIVGGQVAFRPGHLLRSILENRWLVIDELNRADMDRIFGPIFTWLSGGDGGPDVSLGRRSPAPNEPSIELSWSDGTACDVEGRDALDGAGEAEQITFRAGGSWRLLGTYNAVDAQRVFRIGQALGRRFVRVPVPPIAPEDFRDALESAAGYLDEGVVAAITALYEAHLAEAMTTLGPALFFRMADYLRAAEAMPEEEEPADAAAAALAEAYLVNVGPWLARLEEDELDGLGTRVAAPDGPLREAEWTWLKSIVKNLG